MADIYEQHRAAFARTEAYVILDGDKLVARVAFRHPADGAGRLYAYVHWIGSPMVRGFASGGGYDKRSAACASAARKITDIGDRYHRLVDALSADAGQHWDGALRGAGFTVFQAC